MTTSAVLDAPEAAPQATDDRPQRRRRSPGSLAEVGGSAIVAIVAMVVAFHLAGLSAPFGFVICAVLAFLTIYGAVSWRRAGVLAMKDRLATISVWLASAIAILPLVLILQLVFGKGFSVMLNHFPHFLVSDLRHTAPSDPISKAGIGQAIVGSIEQVGLAAVLTVPVAILAAIYLNESKGRFASPLRSLVEAMSSMPTIIAGLIIYLVWVVPRKTEGASGFAAALALGLLMAPMVTRAAEEVLRIVPGSLREASLALGASEWRTTLKVVLPSARAGLITAVLLGMARSVGETAPVLFTAGGSASFNWNPFHHQQADLALLIFGFIESPSTNSTAEAWGAAAALVTLVLIFFTIARVVGSGNAFRLLRRARTMVPINRPRTAAVPDHPNV